MYVPGEDGGSGFEIPELRLWLERVSRSEGKNHRPPYDATTGLGSNSVDDPVMSDTVGENNMKPQRGMGQDGEQVAEDDAKDVFK